jgi:hypothetical protein
MTNDRNSDPSWTQRYGPWALVTGASDGIGRDMAREIAARGVNVMLVARRYDRLEALAVELHDRFAVETAVIVCDLADPDAVNRLIDETGKHDIGLLAACAGYGTSGPLLDTDMSDELTMIDVNCRAVAALTKAFGKRLAARGRGGIVLMSSIVAFQGVANAANYAATKAYVQSLAEGLRVELSAKGVDIVASAPGPVDSGFADRAHMRMGATVSPSIVARSTVAALGRKSIVRPGLLTQVLSAGLAMLPRRGRIFIMRQVMNGMTKHQHAGQTSYQPH